MKAKVGRGNGFRGTLNYVLDEGKKRTGNKLPKIVAGNMSHKTAKDLTREFSFSRRLRMEVKNPVWHCSLALPAGEKLAGGEWDRVANKFLQEMGLDTGKHQFVGVTHADTDNDHIHLVVSRIGLDGELWHGRNDVMNAIEATQKLEKEFGLTLTAGYFELDANGNKLVAENGKNIKRKTPKRNPKPQEIQMAARTGEAPQRLVVQQIIDEAIKEKSNVFDFIERLEAGGVTVRPNVAKTGRLNGFSFEYQGVPFKGSDLGDDYKWSKDSKLKQTIVYEQDADGARLVEVAEQIKQRQRTESAELTKPSEEGRATPGPNDDQDKQANDHDGRGERQVGQRSEIKPEADNNSVRSNDEGAKEHSGLHSENSLGDHQSHVLSELENKVQLLSGRTRTWNAVHNTADALAAPLNSDSGSSQQSPDHVKKVKEWHRQHEALGAPAYRLTLIPRQKEDAKPWVLGKKADGGEDLYSAEEVEAKIPLLRQKNAQGYDIYITPIDDDNHYLVIDDVTESELKRLKERYHPNLVQESSKDNYQAIFKHAKQPIDERDEDAERETANLAVLKLNKVYGDKNFSGAVHPFRMAGFSNKKAGRNNAFTRIASVSHAVCERLTNAFKDTLEQFQKRRDEVAKRTRLDLMSKIPNTKIDVNSVFSRHWNKWAGLADKNGWNKDLSVIDFNACKDTLQQGFSDELVAKAIKDCSPNVEGRKGNLEKYAEETVTNARKQLATLPKLTPDQKVAEDKKKKDEPKPRRDQTPLPTTPLRTKPE